MSEETRGKRTDETELVVRSITFSGCVQITSEVEVDGLGLRALGGESMIGTPMKLVIAVTVSGKVSPSESSIASTISAVKRVDEGAFPPRRQGMLIWRERGRGGTEVGSNKVRDKM